MSASSKKTVEGLPSSFWQFDEIDLINNIFELESGILWGYDSDPNISELERLPDIEFTFGME